MTLEEQIDCANNIIKENQRYIVLLKERQAKEFAKPKSKRILFDVGWCWSIDETGNFCDTDLSVCKNDNAFVDEESAQLQSQRNTLVHKMRLAALECPVDWSDKDAKFYPKWLFLYNMFEYVGTETQRDSQLPHFASQVKLQDFMSSLSTDERKLLICGVE
jgi:hypothetical protein